MTSLRLALAAGLLVLAGLASASAPRERAPRLEDFIEPPGTRIPLQPFMLHADYWQGLDMRSPLDSIVFALENGARCCQVLGADSLWAVDYTWIYPHDLLPPRWYDAQELFRVGDSLHLADDAQVRFTFGTLRTGVHAGSFAQAHDQALKHWPTVMPGALRGRLRIKLERAVKAMRGKDPDTGAPVAR